MRFYKIDTKGKMWLDRRPTLPAWVSGDEGRMLYAEDSEDMYLGQSADWTRIFTDGSKLTADIWSDNELVQVLENSPAGTTAWFKGDVRAENSNVILVSAADYANSYARLGIVRSPDGFPVLDMSGGIVTTIGRFKDIRNGDTGSVQLLELSNLANSWFMGDVRSDNGVSCLVNGATPAGSTFLGISTRARYA